METYRTEDYSKRHKRLILNTRIRNAPIDGVQQKFNEETRRERLRVMSIKQRPNE